MCAHDLLVKKRTPPSVKAGYGPAQSHFYEFILLDKLQYVIGELFSR